MTETRRLWAITGTAAAMVAVLAALVYLTTKLIRKMNNKPTQPIIGPITSPFGKRKAPVAGASTTHNGVDVAATVGTTVRAPWDGTVLDIYNDTKHGGGKTMLITHTNGFRTGYCHLSDYIARKGQQVKQGDPICRTGNTGTSTGPHLHFSLRDENNARVDPQQYGFTFKESLA